MLWPMQPDPVFEHLYLGYSPVLDAARSLTSTRLTVFPVRPGQPVSGAALLQKLQEAFELPDARDPFPVSLLLNVADEALLDEVLAAAQQAPCAAMIEIPNFLATDPQRLERLLALRAAGQRLAIGGRPLRPLPPELVPCFRHAVVDFQDDRRTQPQGLGTPVRTVTTISSGVRRTDEIEQAFTRGAVAVIGWPVDDDPVVATGTAVPPDLRGVIELMNRVEREEPAERMETVLTSDPSLAFRLLRYLNSAAFGLRVEVTSFKHALMLLGHQRLKRWLALLLVSGSKDVTQRPLMHVAARRGLLMEELARSFGDEEMRGEMFICGVFSLLDRLMRQPFDELMKFVPVQHRVQQSLLGSGPYSQHLALVEAVEQASAIDLRERAEQVLIAPTELNRALLKALAAARELD